jgi:hypothetical protein
MKREGYFENGRARGRRVDQLYPLPLQILDARVKDGFTCPVLVYDHGEGCSATDGFAYHGRIAALAESWFSAIFRADAYCFRVAAMKKKADQGIPQTVAPIEEVQLCVRNANGKRVAVSFRT